MATSHHLDLVGVPCPLSWAKTKVVLADLAPGDLLELILDDPRGARDLPRAAEAEGHHVVSERTLADSPAVATPVRAARWVIVLEK